MVAPAAISDPAAVRQPRAVAERLACSTLVATTATLVALAGYLVWRRACGGLRQPLDALSLSAVGVGAVALVAALRSGWQWVGLGLAHRRGLAALLWLAPSLAVLTLLAAVSVPGTPGLGQAAAGGCVLVSEAIWLALIWRTRGRHVAVPAAASASETHAASGNGAAGAGWQSPGERAALRGLPPDVSQQFTRFHSPRQGEVAEGVLRAAFAPGQRSRNLHVAFCPPLPGRPQVDVAQVAGPALRVKVADAQAFGIRFDVRLQAASPQEENVVIHFQARCAP